MTRRRAACALALATALAAALTMVGAGGAVAAQRTPIQYLLGAQNRDGGFGPAPGQRSDTMDSGWATLALADADADASAPAATQATMSAALTRAVGYLQRTLRSERGAGDLERTAIAVGAAGGPWSRFHSLRRALPKLIGRDGSVEDQTNLTAFAILALRAADLPIPRRTLAWLVHQQDRDGGFNWATRGGRSDVDDTGAVLCALAPIALTAGQPSRPPGPTPLQRTAARAVAFVRSQQDRDGGFGAALGASSNAQSTAFAVSGLVAAGVRPAGLHRRGAPSPTAYLYGLVQSNGAVNYARKNPQTPVWVTAEAEIALSGDAL